MPHTLDSRSRILRAIDNKDIDRVPCFFRAEQNVINYLMQNLQLRSRREIESYFGSDATQTQVDLDYKMLPNLTKINSAEEVDAMPWPTASQTFDIGEAINAAQRARATGLAVYGGVWASVFTHSRDIIGEERYLLSMVENPDMIKRIIERLTDLYLEANEALFSVCSKDIDIFYFGSDFGTQLSMFISPEMFRTFFKPNLSRLTDHAKGFGLKVMFHTCGAISKIINDLIECGIDILDPVQVSASGMNPHELAANFKGRICFHGGISTQTTLPFGDPDAVRKDVLNTIEALGPLGYIAAPDQHLIGNIPLCNIKALYDTVRNYRC